MIDLLRSATPELWVQLVLFVRYCTVATVGSLAMFAMWTILLYNDVPRLSKNGLIKFDRHLLQMGNGSGKCQRRDR